MNKFYGTITLAKFALRRDRIRLMLWILGISSLAVVCAPLFPEIAKTATELAAFSETMNNPAMIAMTGPVYAEPYTYGILYSQMMITWVLILVSVMNFFLVSGLTRRDEEEGRIEILRSLPIGQASILASTWLISLLANFAAGTLTALGLIAMRIESMDPAGCLTIGAIIFFVGMLFTAIAMIFSQVCLTSKGSISFSFILLGVLYLLGAMGNISGGPLANISPFSFVFKTSPFAGNHVWPLFIILFETIVLGLISMKLNLTRDLGGGFIPQKNGRAHASASLSSPFGLAFRRTKNSNIAWIIIMLVVGAMYGSIFGDFESFVDNSELFRTLIQADVNAGANAMLSFMTYITLLMSMIVAIPVIGVIYRIRGEEKRGRIEAVYANPVSKLSYLGAHIGIAIVLSVLLQAAEGLGLWLSSNFVMSDPFLLSDVIASGMVKLPGIWLLAGLGVFLIGILPKLTSVIWVYFAVSFFALYMGRVMDLPDIVMDSTAFGALPNFPTEDFVLLPVLVITAVSIALLLIGAMAYNRREIMYR